MKATYTVSVLTSIWLKAVIADAVDSLINFIAVREQLVAGKDTSDRLAKDHGLACYETSPGVQ